MFITKGRIAGVVFLVLVLSASSALADSVGPDDSSWQLVRRVSDVYNAWHPATDNLAGTSTYSYGTGSMTETSDLTFSVNFENAVPGWDQILLITGDRQIWMIFEASELSNMTDSLGGPMTILSSYESSSPYEVIYVNRPSGNPEDPWLSPQDHFAGGSDQSHDSDAHSMLYGESNFPNWSYWRLNHDGANVFIRQSLPDSVVPLPAASLAGAGFLLLLGLLGRLRSLRAELR